MGKTALDLNGVKALASLPSLDELRAKLVASSWRGDQDRTAHQRSAAKVARVIQAYASKSAAADGSKQTRKLVRT